MTKEEKIKYIKVALNIVGFNFKPKDLDMIVSVYDLVLEKKGNTDLDSLVKLQFEIEKKYMEK